MRRLPEITTVRFVEVTGMVHDIRFISKGAAREAARYHNDHPKMGDFFQCVFGVRGR